MVSRIGGDSAGAPTCHRQLPITYFAHKTTTICYDGVGALLVLAARDIAAESGSAARLDGAHHFQLCVAHVATVGITPSGTEVAEDIRNFQSGALHDGAETTSEGSSWIVVALAYRAGSRPRAAPWSRRGRSARWCPASNGQAGTSHNAHPLNSLKVKHPLVGIWC